MHNMDNEKYVLIFISGVEVVKASLDLTGKYPNTKKGRIGFWISATEKSAASLLYREEQLVLLP